MSSDAPRPDEAWRRDFHAQIQRRRRRRERAMTEGDRSLLRDLGVFGMVGWSVTVPTLLGTALGLWLDRRIPGSYSWTLMLLCAGAAIGCWNAWEWVRRHQHDDGDG